MWAVWIATACNVLAGRLAISLAKSARVALQMRVECAAAKVPRATRVSRAFSSRSPIPTASADAGVTLRAATRSRMAVAPTSPRFSRSRSRNSSSPWIWMTATVMHVSC